MRLLCACISLLTTLAIIDWAQASIVMGTYDVQGKQTVAFAGRTQAELTAIVPSDSNIAGRSSLIADIADFVNTSPDAISIAGFDTLSITATGLWSNTPHLSSHGMSPSGDSGVNKSTKDAYRSFGISGISARLNTLLGVFLSDDVPDPGSLPQRLSVNAGDDMTTPLLNQTFAIGDDLSNIIVPENATRLFLGHHDGHEFKNNTGSATATITGTSANELNVVPEPSTVVIWVVFAVIGYKSMRFGSVASA